METHMTKRKVLPAPKSGSIPKIKVRKAVKAIATKVHKDKKRADVFKGKQYDDWYEQRRAEAIDKVTKQIT